MRKFLLFLLFCISSTVYGNSDCFKEYYYKDFYPDVVTSVAEGKYPNAKAHYDAVGKQEGRVACPRNTMENLCRPHPGDPHACKLTWGPTHTNFSAQLNILIAIALIAAALLFRLGFRIWVPVAIAAGLSALAFWPYLTGERIFVFRDIATDTVDQFWPAIFNLARSVHEGDFPFWSHSAGMGQAIFPSWLSDPFSLLAILSGPSGVSSMLGFVNFLKPILACLFIALYLRERGLSPYAIVLGSLSVAFCGHFIVRVSWYHYATEVVAVSFYLFANERFIRRGDKILLPLATAAFALPGSHQAYLNGLLATVYTFCRIFIFDESASGAKKWKSLGEFFALSALGALLVSPILLTDVYQTLGSNRLSGRWSVYGSVFDIPLTARSDDFTLYTSLARLFSPNLLGGPLNYRGALNFLEASAVYSGLLALPSLLMSLFVLKGKKRAVVSVFFLLIVGYHFYTHIRMVFNGYAGPYFKISNFWMQLGLGLVVAEVVHALETQGKRWHWSLLFLSVGLSMLIYHYVRISSQSFSILIDQSVFKFSSRIALVFGLASLGAFFWKKSARLALSLITLGVVVDLGLNALYALNKERRALDGKLFGLQSGYFDAAYQTIQRIKELDHSPYYRIERSFNSVQFNDALVQGYFGTKSYFSFTNPAYSNFLSDFGLLADRARPESYLDGLGNNPLVLHILGIRYFLSVGSGQMQGFEPFFSHGDVFAQKSRFDLSGGFVYDRVIRYSDLMALASTQHRQLAIVDGLVLDDKALPEQAWLKPNPSRFLASGDSGAFLWPEIEARLREHEARRVSISEVSNNHVQGHFRSDVDGFLFIPISYDKGWSLKIDGEKVEYFEGNVGFITAKVKAGEHVFEMTFRPPMLYPSLVSFAIGFVILLFLLRKRSQKRKQVSSTFS